MPCFSAVVPDGTRSERLDKVVPAMEERLSRSRLKGTMTSLFVNGSRAKLSTKVRAGDRIDVEWEEDAPTGIEPEDIPLDVIYEDGDVTVVNKRQGMVVHPASGNWTGTLVSALLFRWGRGGISLGGGGTASEELARRRPGIVHRLDKDTSGVIVTARNLAAEDWLHAQFADHGRLVKEYVAICVGRPPARTGRICAPIGRDPSDRKKFRAAPEGEGKAALTLYTCLAVYTRGNETYSLVRLRIKTGRTHQIRVHMRSVGCPVLGDPLYGRRPSGTFRTATLMLHSRLLRIRLPGRARAESFVAPLPPRFVKVLKALREKFARSQW